MTEEAPREDVEIFDWLEASAEVMGDGSMVDYVKQDICRGADTPRRLTNSLVFRHAFRRLSAPPLFFTHKRFSSNTQTYDTRETEPGLIAGLTHLLLHGAPAARVTR